MDKNFLTVPLKEELRRKIEELEPVLAQGEFFYKPFIVSGEEAPDAEIGASVCSAVGANIEEEKFLVLTGMSRQMNSTSKPSIRNLSTMPRSSMLLWKKEGLSQLILTSH